MYVCVQWGHGINFGRSRILIFDSVKTMAEVATVPAVELEEDVEVSIPASSEPLGIKFSSAHPMAAPRIQGFAKNSRASGKLKRNWPMNCPF